MLVKLPPSLLALVLLGGDFCHALRLNFEGRRVPRAQRRLAPRASLAGSSPLEDSADLQYMTNITLGGQAFEVLIDTGSSDLWVAGSVSSASDTGKAATIQYASGGASGPVRLATLDFAGSSVDKQSYIEVPPDSDHPAGQGLIGLGPSAGSVVFEAFSAQTEGITVLDNIFLQNTATPNFITFQLGRLTDPDAADKFPGDLTVGEVVEGRDNITAQPKLPVTVVSRSNAANQHFQVLLDANGFIGPDGNPISYSSVVSGTSNKKQATVVIDTGFSLPQVPTSVAKNIYNRFQGAELVNDPAIGEVWYVPCTAEVNITLKFGGIEFPVHPLDAAADPKTFGLSARKTSAGVNACIGLFQPVSFNTGSNPTYDMIFGMAFLRNVYTLINFGDFIADTSGKADPYIQFLSVTDRADAHQDFVNVRLNGVDNGNTVLLNNADQSNDSDSSDSFFSDAHRTRNIIIAGAALGVIVLLLVLAFFCRRRASNRRGVYAPLNVPHPNQPAPPYAPPMQQTQPYGVHPPVYNPDRPYDPPTEYVPYHNPFEGQRH